MCSFSLDSIRIDSKKTGGGTIQGRQHGTSVWLTDLAPLVPHPSHSFPSFATPAAVRLSNGPSEADPEIQSPDCTPELQTVYWCSGVRIRQMVTDCPHTWTTCVRSDSNHNDQAIKLWWIAVPTIGWIQYSNTELILSTSWLRIFYKNSPVQNYHLAME